LGLELQGWKQNPQEKVWKGKKKESDSTEKLTTEGAE
jgi:hypothetical protein